MQGIYKPSYKNDIEKYNQTIDKEKIFMFMSKSAREKAILYKRRVPLKNYPNYLLTRNGVLYKRTPPREGLNNYPILTVIPQETIIVNERYLVVWHIETPDGVIVMPVKELLARTFLRNRHHLPCVKLKNGLYWDLTLDNVEWAQEEETGPRKIKETLLRKYSEKLIRKVCEYLCEECHTNAEISDLTGVDTAVVSRIKKRAIYKDIVSEYMF